MDSTNNITQATSLQNEINATFSVHSKLHNACLFVYLFIYDFSRRCQVAQTLVLCVGC